MMNKKNLKVRDIERLENTSFSALALTGTELPEPDPAMDGASCTCACRTCLCCLPQTGDTVLCCDPNDLFPPVTAPLVAGIEAKVD